MIAAAERSGGAGFPWEDAARFTALCLEMAEADWVAASGITIFDRGLLEPCLSLRRVGHAAPFERFRPYDAVVLAEPWPEIYATDPARRHGLAEAISEFEDIQAFLATKGPAPWILPKSNPVQRAEWLETRLRAL